MRRSVHHARPACLVPVRQRRKSTTIPRSEPFITSEAAGRAKS